MMMMMMMMLDGKVRESGYGTILGCAESIDAGTRVHGAATRCSICVSHEARMIKQASVSMGAVRFWQAQQFRARPYPPRL